MKTLCLVSGHESACDHYRGSLPFRHCSKALEAEGIQLVIPPLGGNLAGHDAYVFYRAIDPSLYPFVVRLKMQGVPFAWDLDDNIFAVPEWSPAHKAFPPHLREMASQCITFADQVSVSTTHLRDAIEAVSDKTSVLPNLVDLDDWPNHGWSAPGSLRVMWAGSETHERDLEVVVPALRAAKEAFGDRIQIVMAGYCPPAILNDPIIDPLFIHGVRINHYPRFLSFCRPSIALAPLSDDAEDAKFNRCKSAIKHLEFTMAGAVVVASDMPPYSDVIEDGTNGHLCQSDDWPVKLRQVIHQRLAAAECLWPAASRIVREDHSWQSDKRNLWLDFYRKLVAVPLAAAA